MTLNLSKYNAENNKVFVYISSVGGSCQLSYRVVCMGGRRQNKATATCSTLQSVRCQKTCESFFFPS